MNKNMRVLISALSLQKDIDRYKDIFQKNNLEIVLPKVSERLNEDELLKIIDQYDGVICGDDVFTKKVLDKAKKLKIIVKWGTGIDSIDIEYAKKLGISVCNTPGAFSAPVADTVMGFILCFARKILGMDEKMKKGAWGKEPGHSLFEKTIGIIGVGNIGQELAKRANSFGMKILGNDIKKIPEEITKRYNIEMTDKKTLFRESDYISLNCNLNETSYHLIDLDEIKLMKKDAVIINTARGPVIKEEDLIIALKNKMIAGAALDVFEKEPLLENSPLREFDNVLLSSHNANNSPYFWEKVHQNSISRLLLGLNVHKVTAILPMRSGSQLIKDKNIKIINGRPSYEYILTTLFNSQFVDKIIITTDIPEIIERYRNDNRVIIIERPRELRGNCNINWVIKDVLSKVDGEYFLQVHDTHPLLKRETLDLAIKKFFDNLPEKQNLFSVTKLQKRFWWKDGKPINHNPNDQPTTQILEPYFEENSCFYIFSRSSFKEKDNRIGKSPYLFEIKPIESVDIDVEEDLGLAEKLLINKKLCLK